jgi:hypothetical protein
MHELGSQTYHSIAKIISNVKDEARDESPQTEAKIPAVHTSQAVIEIRGRHLGEISDMWLTH